MFTGLVDAVPPMSQRTPSRGPELASTRWLFIKLLRALRIDAICDVGSLDGTDALAFRAAVPRATLFAFEANPDNLRLMQADSRLQERAIHVAPVAVTNVDGVAEFFVVRTRQGLDHLRGMSSLYARSDASQLAAVVPVTTARLDTFLRATSASARWAFWIDVEGKAFEAVEGAAEMRDRLHLIHVEVETTPCIGRDQKLAHDVTTLLRSWGFVELAREPVLNDVQFNLLFVRADLGAGPQRRVVMWLTAARIRRLAIQTLRRLRGW